MIAGLLAFAVVRGFFYFFMRFLASYGIFAEQANKTFALTALAQPLLSNHPDTLREWLAGHDGYEKRWQTYGHLDYSIKTGRPAFNELFGEGYFDFISKDAVAAEKFDSGMSNISAGEEEVLVKDYNFSGYKKIVDVGGGVGRLLLQIIKNNPAINCQLFDLPHTIAAAKRFLTEQGVQKSIECEAGSFFDRIPAGADLYVLKRILHDWDDEQCKIILKNCKTAMQPGSKLLILETVVPEGNSRSISKDIDIMMLTLFGGKERTKIEWQELLASVGLKLINVKTTALMLSIIEAE